MEAGIEVTQSEDEMSSAFMTLTTTAWCSRRRPRCYCLATTGHSQCSCPEEGAEASALQAPPVAGVK
eukprot:2092918-Heterocapsa_arctica.AAC.1